MSAPPALGQKSTPAELERGLERGEVAFFPACPFPLPVGDDLRFLLEQRLGPGHKNVGFDPYAGRVTGFRRNGDRQAERLGKLFAAFSKAATGWLGGKLPRYARSWKLDRISYRPEEEATRRLRLTARNDLLHVDAFPNRPTNGHRILRLFVNVNPTEPRVWLTSDPFAVLFERYGTAAGLPGEGEGLSGKLRGLVARLFRPGKPRRSAYDSFMLRFHNYLKAHEGFQKGGNHRRWSFPPGSVWLAFTDACSHAVLSGRFALEHSYFVPPDGLALPDESPAALLAKACGSPVLHRAA